MKRTVDILVSSTALVVLAPVLLCLAAIVRFDSPGPALFRQRRVGRSGRPFWLYKFRSMQTRLTSGPLVTVGGDGRITRIGRWLRTTKLDELPQLWNVLRGDMSLVGPRPEVPNYVALWPVATRSFVLSVAPGITDPAAIAYRNEEQMLQAASDPERHYREVIMPAKLRLYCQYVAERSWWGDLKILAATARAVCSPRLAHEER